jgi:hypothetical protein
LTPHELREGRGAGSFVLAFGRREIWQGLKFLPLDTLFARVARGLRKSGLSRRETAYFIESWPPRMLSMLAKRLALKQSVAAAPMVRIFVSYWKRGALKAPKNCSRLLA